MRKFLDGAKSEILKYDVISFDIFDTLLLRPFIKPTDLFLYIETKSVSYTHLTLPTIYSV